MKLPIFELFFYALTCLIVVSISSHINKYCQLGVSNSAEVAYATKEHHENDHRKVLQHKHTKTFFFKANTILVSTSAITYTSIMD